MSNENQSSGQGRSNNSNNKKRRRRRPTKNKSNQGERPQSADQNSQKKRRPVARKRGPKLSGIEKAERGYLNLLEKHMEARRKYYDLFHRADPRQLAKLEKNFSRSIKELRDYEDSISEDLKEEFDKKFNGLRLDTTYSENHELPADPENIPTEGNFEDPHVLPTQVNHDFKEDTEESVGSMDDYHKYKGTNPTPKEVEPNS